MKYNPIMTHHCHSSWVAYIGYDFVSNTFFFTPSKKDSNNVQQYYVISDMESSVFDEILKVSKSSRVGHLINSLNETRSIKKYNETEFIAAFGVFAFDPKRHTSPISHLKDIAFNDDTTIACNSSWVERVGYHPDNLSLFWLRKTQDDGISTPAFTVYDNSDPLLYSNITNPVDGSIGRALHRLIKETDESLFRTLNLTEFLLQFPCCAACIFRKPAPILKNSFDGDPRIMVF